MIEDGVQISPGYYVNIEGQVYTKMPNGGTRTLKHRVRGSYPVVKIGGRATSVHRLVAKAFCPNPNNKPFVNHLDGNTLNCHASNLEWCTAAENTQHAVNTGLITYSHKGLFVRQVCPATHATVATHKSLLAAAKAVGLTSQTNLARIINHPTRLAGGFLWKRDEDPNHNNEVWRPITECDGYDLSEPPYSVSSSGRVRSDRNGRILSPVTSKTNGGYHTIRLRTKGSNRVFLVHRLVATAFVASLSQKRGLVVNHINGNRTDNQVNNLEWVTSAVNTQKAVGKTVMQIDAATGKVIASFLSQGAAAKAMKVDHTAIFRAIKFRHKCCGYKWINDPGNQDDGSKVKNEPPVPDQTVAVANTVPQVSTCSTLLSDLDVDELLALWE